MIGMGLDLCEIARIERALQKSDAFLQRFFTEEESEYVRSRGNVGPQSAAAMFAAKEALLKAMGIGLSGGVSLKEIGITHGPQGQPGYVLTGAALQRLEAMGGTRLWLSLSHEAGMAAAVAVIE